MLLNLKFISAKNTSKSDLKTNHTRVMYTYSLLHQRRFFWGNSSINILPPPPPGLVRLTKSPFYLINLEI